MGQAEKTRRLEPVTVAAGTAASARPSAAPFHGPTDKADHPECPLSVRDLTVAYQRRPVVWDVNFDLPPGQLIGLVGPNGAGKSTLLKAALDLIPSTSGRIRFFGKPYAEVRHRIGYVPQRESVDWDFPVSALDVVAMGLYRKIGWFRRIRGEHRARAMAALEQVGIGDLAQRQISQLSGGQQQRTFLARALVQDADLYLMDEPFAAVDAATEQAIIETLRQMKTLGKTAFVIHHDLQSVPGFFDQVLLLNMRVVAFGPVEEVFTPDNLHKTYGGRLTLLDEATEAMRRRRM